MIPNHPFSPPVASSCVYDELEPYSLRISLQFLSDQLLYLMTLSYTYTILTLLLYLPMYLPNSTSGLDNIPTLIPETQNHVPRFLLERTHDSIPSMEDMGTLVYYKICDEVEAQTQLLVRP